MAENGNKKRRIARIGNMSCGKGTTKLHCDDGLVTADENLVYNIMESMDKSQVVMSYQQYQEFRSKEKSTRTNKSDQNSSSKQNTKIASSKQIKKFVPEKTFPLMAKCQKSMKYLKKNRCIPKPRAHVGYVPKPPQNSINFQPNNFCSNGTVSNNTVNYNESSMKLKQSTKNSRHSPKMNDSRPKKAKTSHSVDNSSDTEAFQINSFDKDTDSDNEFEQFLQNHHPKRYVRRKTEKRNKFKRRKELICAKKIVKVTSKTLSESEESAESEVEYNNTLNGNDSTNFDIQETPLKSFQRIVVDDDGSSTDGHVNDLGELNCDSFSSSEDENMTSKSSIKDNVIDSNRLDPLPVEQSLVVSASTSSELKDTSFCDLLKLKCKIPCYVVIKRDPLLFEKAASLHTLNSLVTNTLPLSNSYDDDDDCIIIVSETSKNNSIYQNSENMPSVENGNYNQEKSISKSSYVTEALTNVNDVLNKKLMHVSNSLKPEAEKYSNEKSAEILFGDKSMPMEVQKDENISSDTVFRKSLSNSKTDECFTLSKATRHSHINVHSNECEDKMTSIVNPVSRQMSDLPDNATDISWNNDEATEKEMFNVQILSVKSLNDSDVIVLSDDNEEKETEAVPIMNETKESAEDSDVEIICLHSSTVNEKCVNKNVENILNNETHDKVMDGVKENTIRSASQSSVSVEDDCIILDDLDSPSENTCIAKNVGEEQQSSQVVEGTNNEKPSGNALDAEKESILKTLERIDFNCIKKVLNETASTDTRKESIPAKAENSFCDNIETSERTEKLKQSQNDTCLSQKQTSLNPRITPIDLFEENKIKSSNTSPVDKREKLSKLVQNSNFIHSKSAFINVPSSHNRSSTVCMNSSFNLSAPKSFVSEKEIVSSIKTEPNFLLHSRKNRELLPVNATKVENYESPSDELDIISAKSIQTLDEKDKDAMVKLLELYRAEYKKFTEIKCTGNNVTAGLKLLEDKQAKKLLAISSSIKNLVKKDGCFHKINNEFGSSHNELKSFIKTDPVEKNGPLDEIKKPSEFEIKPSIGSPEIENEDKVKIFNQSVVKIASEDLKSAGSSSSQEVYNHLINSVCAECGEQAMAACLGCAKVYYCSERCGIAYWNKTHYATCRR